VKVAGRWLRNTQHCGVVLTEVSSGAGECPDAIGWKGSYSQLVECKVSISDLRADREKPSSRSERRMGRSRWYLMPMALAQKALALGIVPESWGVLGLSGRQVRVLRDVPDIVDFQVDSIRGEIALLVSVIRRYQVQGITYQTLTGKPVEFPLFEPDSLPHQIPQEPKK
jgi:hypothetical protein